MARAEFGNLFRQDHSPVSSPSCVVADCGIAVLSREMKGFRRDREVWGLEADGGYV